MPPSKNISPNPISVAEAKGEGAAWDRDKVEGGEWGKEWAGVKQRAEDKEPAGTVENEPLAHYFETVGSRGCGLGRFCSSNSGR